MLLDNGADANVTDSKKRTALHFACSSSKVDAVRILLQHGANTNSIDEESNYQKLHSKSRRSKYHLHWMGKANSPLHIACTKNEPEIVKCLLENSADSSQTNADSDIALHVALDWMLPCANETGKDGEQKLLNQCKIILLLLNSAKNHVDVFNRDGDTPYDMWFNRYKVLTHKSEESATRDIALQVNSLMTDSYFLKLKCLTARAILRQHVPYRKQLPVRMAEFVQEHSAIFTLC